MSTVSVMNIRDQIASESALETQNLCFCIAICHTAISSKYGDYICESEDELVLLNAMKQIGFKFQRRSDNIIFLKVFNQEQTFKIVELIPFDPIRKMMSVIVQTEEGDYIMFSKGADSAILGRLNNNQTKVKKIQSKVDSFGKQGFRTMVMAMRKFD